MPFQQGLVAIAVRMVLRFRIDKGNYLRREGLNEFILCILAGQGLGNKKHFIKVIYKPFNLCISRKELP